MYPDGTIGTEGRSWVAPSYQFGVR